MEYGLEASRNYTWLAVYFLHGFGRKAFVTFCLRIQNPTVILAVPAFSWVQAPGQDRECLPGLSALGGLVVGSLRLPFQLRTCLWEEDRGLCLLAISCSDLHLPQ